MNKRQLQSTQTKKLILDKAKELFIQKGYTATSIENISTSSGCSKANIYHHFTNKEGLFLYILEEWESEWVEQWDNEKNHYPTSTTQLFGIAKHLVLNDLNHPITNACDEFFTVEKSNSLVSKRIYHLIDIRVKIIQNLLEEGIQSNEFKECDTNMVAKVLDGLLNGLSYNCRDLTTDQTLHLYEQAISIFLSGIENKQSK